MMDKIVINNMLVTENQDAEVHEVMQEATLENLEVTPVAIVEESQDVVAQEVVQNVEVEDIETFVVEVNETFITMDVPNDALNHALLNNRELPNQHPIIAIEGLRQELDQIESLKTVYSDKKQQADYYMWRQDTEHPLPANPYGLFVSILKDTDKIQICDGTSDVFGVTVAEAAFVGNQEYIQAEGGTKTGRDGNYCLVVNSGLAAVRRMPSVVVGDYVVPNSRGEAQKSDGDYGYLVTAVSDDNGLYAIISLNIPSKLAKTIADSVEDLGERMTTAEYNITSVTNAANSAYALALDAKENAEVNSEYIEEKIEEVFGRMDAVDGVVGNLSESVNNASANAALAKTIAEGAVNSANAMKDEAVTKANEALTEASNTRKDLEENVEQINTNLNNTNLELQATKEGFASDIDSLRLDVEGEVADFRKEVEDNYATTTQLAAVKTETSDALAALKTEVSDTYATIESVASLKTDTFDALVGFKQEVSETYATQEMLTSLETETSKSLTDYKQEVTDTYATQEMVTKLETDTTKAIADYKQEVTDTYATQEIVSSLETSISKALTDYKQEVKDNYATQEMLTNLETDTSKALADYKQEATNTYATQEMLTSFEGETNKSMASLKQQADDNGAKIEALVANVDKYAVGEYSQAYGLTLEQAKNILIKDETVYVPTIVHSETYDADTQEFSLGYYYTWKVDQNDTSEDPKCKWIPSQSTAVSFDSKHVGGSTSSPYWVVETANVELEVVKTFDASLASNSKTYYDKTNKLVYAYNLEQSTWLSCEQDTPIEEGQTKIIYDLGGLYLWKEKDWVKVASAADNVLSRAVSAIKVTANSIETSVTAIDNKYAGTKTWVDSNQAAIQDTVTWHSNNGDSLVTFMQEAEDNFASATQVAQIVDKDGNIKAASIVTAVNEDTSDVTIKANKINFEGSQFQSMMSQTYSTKDEVVTAKQEAIKAAGDSVDEKLKDYSTTTQMQSVIDQKADSIMLSVSQTYSTKDEMGDIEERVTDAEASIQINKDNIALKADKVDLDGYVTFTNLATEGQTTIHGGNIETDTLSAITANLGTVNSGNIQSPGYMEPVIWGSDATAANAVTTLDIDELEIESGSSAIEEGISTFAIEDEVSVAAIEQTTSSGLAFAINSNKASYSVTGMGSCNDTKVIIPPTYEGLPVTQISNSAFRANKDITSVTIPDSITKINWGAFWQCSNLQKVTLGEKSQLTYIGGYAFHSCSSLVSIMIPSKVTEIKELAFYNCKALEEIYFNAANMNDLPYAHNVRNLLSGTKAFENVKLISGADTTQKYEDFTVCYYDASALTSTKEYKDIITFNTISPKLKTKYTLSFFAKGVGKITTYLWNNGEGVVQIVSGESSQGKLVTSSDGSCTFDLNDEWNRYWVTYEFGASGTIAPKTTLFRIWGGNNTKASLCGVQLEERGTATDWTPSKEDYGATSVEALDNRVFYNAGTNGNGIKVVIGSNVTKIPAYLFRPHGTSDTSAIAEDRIVNGTPKIVSVEFEKRDIELLINSDAFYGHSGNTLQAVHVPDIKTWCLVDFANEWANPLMSAKHLYCANELVTNLIIPEGITKINSHAFRTCNDIVSIVIPDSVSEVGWCSFNYCMGLKDVILGKGITKIRYYAFNRRDGSGNIALFDHVYYKGTNEEWDNITFEPDGSDHYNHPLTDAPRYYYSEAEPASSGSYWHYKDGFKISCNDDNMIDSKYFKVTQDGEITATAGNIGGCEIVDGQLTVDNLSTLSANLGEVTAGSLASVDFRLDNQVIMKINKDASATATWEEFFDTQGEVTENLTYNNEEAGVCTIMGFEDENDVTEDLIIPNTESYVEIGEEAFNNNKIIEKIIFSDNVYAIRSNAFLNCTELKWIQVPKSISIADNAFDGCSSLNAIFYKGGMIDLYNKFPQSNNINTLQLGKTLNKQVFLGEITEEMSFGIGDGTWYGPQSRTEKELIISLNAFPYIELVCFSVIGSSDHLILLTNEFQVCLKETILTEFQYLDRYLMARLDKNNKQIVIKYYYKELRTMADSRNVEIEEFNYSYGVVYSDNSSPEIYYNTESDQENKKWYYAEPRGFRLDVNKDNILQTPYFKLDESGAINASKGQIGNVFLSKDGISVHNEDASISTMKISPEKAILKEVNSEKIQTVEICNENSKILLTGSERGASQSGFISVTVTIEKTRVTEKGGWVDTWLNPVYNHRTFRSGEVEIYWGVTNPLDEDKSVACTINFIDENGWFTYSKKSYITIQKGQTGGIDTINEAILVNNKVFYFTNIELNETTVQKPIYDEYTIGLITCQGSVYPSVGDRFILGKSSLAWKDIYTKNTPVVTSDRNKKNSIETLSNNYDIFFDNLQPVRYKFNQNESNRYHVGFISQDVRDALEIAETPTSDFAGYIAYDKEDGTTGYGLRYSEFIALNTDQIQKLKKRTAELENTIEELKSIIEELKTQQNDCLTDNQEEAKGDETNGTETTPYNP